MNFMKKQLFISLILVVLFSTITFAIDYAPDNYDFRIWQGDYNTITTSIEGWAVRCDTTISNENHDQTNGYVCNKNVGTVASPSYCAVEGNIYSQLRIYHSSDANVAPNQYVYSICPSDSQTSCTGYSTSSSVSGILVYTVDWDGQQGHCENANCAPGFAYPSSYDWSIGGEVASTTCCGDDTGERVQTCTDSSGQGACGGDTTACCTLTTDCIDDAGACQDTAACYGVGVFGNSYCSAGSWEDPDEGSGYCVASCDVTGGDGGIAWNPGGEGAGATACCGDDAGEYRDIETQGSDAPALFDDSSDACCDTTTDCTEASICYTTGQVTGSIPNRGYCSSGSWLGGDASQTACDNIVGVNYWNIGGEVDPTACCTDDTGENKELEVSGTDAPSGYNDGTDACCNLATDCVESSTCFSTTVSTGSFPNEAYCNIGTWEGGDAGSTQCSGVGGFWNIGGEVDPTACCEDDTGENRDVETQGSDAPALFDDGTDACCIASTDCVEVSTCFNTGQVTGSIPNRGYCSSGSWLGGDASQTACDNVVGVNYWNIGGEVDPTACCTDDSGEYKQIEVSGGDAPPGYNDGTDACCNAATDCVEAGVCYSDTTLIGSFPNEAYCNAGTWEGSDDGPAQCSAAGGFWNIGGEVDPTACCEDDTGENRDVETQGSDAPALFDDGTDACCIASTDCVEADVCYDTGQVTGTIPNRGYCSSGSWLGGDASQTACDNIVGVNYWNIGGEVDPTACCTDDTGENKELEVSGTDAPALFDDGTDACCNLATDCIEAGTCYSTTVTFGSFPNEGYCNAGTWQGGDAGSTQCSAVGGFWNIGGEVDPTLCCEDDTGENRDIETQGSDAPALFDDGTDACCNLATDCIEAGTCYSTTVTFGSFPNEGYCNAGTWLGGDASQTACDAIIGSSGQWNIGGEVDPTLCCEDDSGEYFKQNATYGTDACCDQPTDEVDASGNCDGGTLLILGVGTNLANVTVNDPVLLWANYSDVELLAEITGATVIINITYLATLPVVTEAVMNYNATSERYEYTFNPQNLGLYEFTVKANKTGYSTRIETLQFSITTGQLQGYLSASPQVVKNGDAINFSYIAYKANYTVLLNTSTVSNELLPMGDMNQDGIYTASTTVNNNGDEIVTVVATVYFELDTWTVSTTVIVDNTPPETAVVLIDDDNSITYNQFVELKLNYSDTNGISACRYANNLTVLSNTLFEDCTPVKTWKLTDGIGAKTLFFEVKDNAGNTIVVNDTILYDRVEEALLIIRPEPDANLKETYNVEIVAPSDTTKVRTELINSSGTVVTINDVDLSDGWNATINTLLYNDGLYNLTVTSYSTILYLLETQTAQRTIPINIVNWVTLSQAPLAVVDDGNYTNTNTSLHFSWYNATSRTQVTYEYRLWNSTIENLTGWIIAWQDTEANVAGSYVEGTQYILEVRYSDIYYNYVNSSFSDGIYVDATAPITYAIDSTTHVNLTWDSDTTGFFNFSGFDETSFAGFSYAFTDNGIATPDSIMDEGINFTITNLADGTHYLFVRSIDEAGNAGNVQNFTVMVDSTKPSTPQMIQGNASGSTSVTFNWTESVDSQSGVDNYYLQIASDQNFTTIIEQGWVGNTLGNTTSLAQGTYFARVKSRNRAGVESYWSSDAPQDVDTTNPSILFNKPVGTVKSATPVIVVMTDEWAYCTYTISGQTYPFRFTNSTYHEVQVSGSGVVNYDVDCYDKVNRQASTSDAFTVDTASQPDGLTLSINDPFYIGEIIDVDVNVTDGGTRIGDINPLDFSLSIDNSQVLDFAVVDNGNGIYTLSFNSPQTPKTYSIEIIVLGYSINDSMSVTPIYLTTQYDAASPATQNKLAYVKTSNYTIGVGSDATTTNIDSATLKVEGDSLGNNYIFLTPPNANVRRHDARLEEKTFLELSNPRFGTASTDEYVVQTMLDYENIILSGNQKVGSGFYSIVITNNGLTSDGKVNITISII